MKTTYNVVEISELLDVCKETVLRWFKEGLAKIDNNKPYLVYGADLIDFLITKKVSDKSKCNSNELYCFTCQMPHESTNSAVSITIKNYKQLYLYGTCIVCKNTIYRFGSTTRLEEYLKNFTILKIHNQHLIETTDPICNVVMEIIANETV